MKRDSKVILMAKEAFASRKAVPEWFADAAPCFERFAALVAAAEIERCAQYISDKYTQDCSGLGKNSVIRRSNRIAELIVLEIRALKDVDE